LSPNCTMRYDEGCRATHLYASCSEGCVVLMLRRYTPVMTELFLRLFSVSNRQKLSDATTNLTHTF
jgi:hypothetical protein